MVFCLIAYYMTLTETTNSHAFFFYMIQVFSMIQFGHFFPLFFTCVNDNPKSTCLNLKTLYYFGTPHAVFGTHYCILCVKTPIAACDRGHQPLFSSVLYMCASVNVPARLYGCASSFESSMGAYAIFILNF